MAQVEIVDKEEPFPYGAKLEMNAKGFYQPKVSIHGDALKDVIEAAVKAVVLLEVLALKKGLPIQQETEPKEKKK